MVERTLIWVQIDEPAGPGLDLRLDRGQPGPVIVGARRSGTWNGADRGSVADTDGGDGSPLRALVALPSSSSAGVRLEAVLVGAFIFEGAAPIIVAALPGQPVPSDLSLRATGRLPIRARYVDAAAAARLVRQARAMYRRRRAAGRRTARPVWLPPDELVADIARYSTAEERLRRLPPRFVRGLRDLLDVDERLLASVERRPEEAVGLLDWRPGRERRSALLVLTDRQLLWLVDHLPPDRYLFDWGVDAELLPLESLLTATISGERTPALVLGTAGGQTELPMAEDLAPELDGVLAHLARFLPGPALRRRYLLESLELDTGRLEPFKQADEAEQRIAALCRAVPDAVATFFAPRRAHEKQSVAVVLTPDELALEADGRIRRLRLRCMRSVALALSPLVGRVELRGADGDAKFSYPAPLATSATAFIRQLRRAWANAA